MVKDQETDYSKLLIIDCPVCGCTEFSQFAIRFDGGKVVNCKRCGHYYLNPPLSQNELEKLYHDDYFVSGDDSQSIADIEKWFSDPKDVYQLVLNWFLQHGGIKSKKVLEIGCGPGRFLAECKKLGAFVTGLDPSSKATEMAKLYYGLEIINSCLGSALKDRRLEELSFDFIVLLETIEHVYKPRELIEQAGGFLKTGGYLVVSTPNFALYNPQRKIYEGFQKWPEHLHFFTSKRLKELLEECGYDTLFTTTVGWFNLGDKIIARTNSNKLVLKIWLWVRKNSFARWLKGWLFHLLNQLKCKEDKLPFAGTHIVCIARKTRIG